ncbi:MAG TPA: M20 family metallopeptidase [Firmicutes bacterium]|nr:M20 family metallopeptidase [Candidatus Fermentithermobacillaceae bacterium]
MDMSVDRSVDRPMEEKVVGLLDEDELVCLTQRLVRIATPNPPADYSVIAPEMKRLMEEAGLEVRIMEGAPGKPNVVGLWRGIDPGGPTLLLDAHMDVVPAGDGWDGDPWAASVRDGAIWGRGAADMKHSLAIMICVVRALKRAGFVPRGSLLLSATNDDETAGQFGLKYVIEQGLQKAGWPMPDFHFLLEASRWAVNVAFKGRVWVKVTVEGKPAHGGTPEKGINAILKMVELFRRLMAMERHTHPLMPADTLNIGTIRGGERPNVVPDTCTATFDYRFVGPCSAEQAVKRFRRVIEMLEGEDPEFKVSEFTVFESRDPVEADPNSPPIRLLMEVIRDLTGREPKLAGTLSAGNAYWSLKKGLTATMTGPGDMSIAHTVKEHIPIKDLVEGAKIVAAYAVRYVG